MNTLQRVVILVWICSVVALAARPPWTVHEIGHYSGGAPDLEMGTTTQFRWFLATPEWETYDAPNEPSTYKFSGKLRFDLLVLEIVMASVAAVGLVLLTGPRTRSSGHV